jgi:hypothetical protein
MIKKIFIISFFLFLSFGFLPHPVFAQQGAFVDDLRAQTKAAGETGAQLTKTDPRLVIANVIKVFLTTLGALFVAYLIYGGVTIFMSAGSEDKINEGKNIIKRAILGLVIILNSYGITYYVTNLAQGNTGPFADGNGAVIYDSAGKSFINRDKEKEGQLNFSPWDCQDPNADCVLSP